MAQPSVGTSTGGAPSFAAFSRRVGGRRMAPLALPFMPRVPETKSSPRPHSPAPAQARPTDRSDNCSSAIPHSSGGVGAGRLFYRVAVYIPQFLYTFLVRPNIEVMEVSLR